MESHSKISKSFHLQTPFAFSGSSFSSESTAAPRGKLRNESLVSSKSATLAPDGTFNDGLTYSKHLAALEELEELKTHYYDQYLENLERKVLKQRRQLVKEKENGTKLQEEEHRKVPLPKLKKLPHHQLTHDKEYMRKVTKSRFYHLLAARDLMQQRGLLKTQSDEDSFWDKVLHDNDIWNNPVPSNLPPQTVTRVMLNRFTSISRLRRITENRERQRVTFSESPSKSFPNAQDSSEGDETSSNKSRDIKLQKLKVKMKLPKLHSLKNVSALPPIQPKTPTIPDSDRKIKRLEKFRSVLHAYDVAMVNHAATRQMLKRHQFSQDKESKFLLGDIVAATVATQSISSLPQESVKPPASQSNSQVFITEPVYGNDQVLIPDLEYKYPNEHLSAKKRVKSKQMTESKQSEDEKNFAKDNNADTDEKPEGGRKDDMSLPLSYTMMIDKGDLKVKTAKSTKSMWVNYATDT